MRMRGVLKIGGWANCDWVIEKRVIVAPGFRPGIRVLSLAGRRD